MYQHLFGREHTAQQGSTTHVFQLPSTAVSFSQLRRHITQNVLEQRKMQTMLAAQTKVGKLGNVPGKEKFLLGPPWHFISHRSTHMSMYLLISGHSSASIKILQYRLLICCSGNEMDGVKCFLNMDSAGIVRKLYEI